MRMTRLEIRENLDEMLHIIICTRHEMTAAEIQPLHLCEAVTELLLYRLQRVFQRVAIAFAVAVAMKSFYATWQYFWQLVSGDAEARSWSTRIVERRLDFTVFGIDAQTATYRLRHKHVVPTLHATDESFGLRHGIKSDVRRAAQNVVERVVFVRGRICMSARTEFVECQPCFPGRRCRGVVDVFAKDGERFPQRKGFEGENEFYASTVGDALDELQVAAQQALF